MQQIKVDDKTFYVHFGSYAVEQFCKDAGWKLSEAMTKLGEITENDLDKIALLIFHGFKDGARKAKEKFDLTVPDIYDLIDEDQNLIDTILKAFVNSMTPADNPAKKKKQTKVAS